MLRFLFDTDHLTLYEHQHPPLLQRMRPPQSGTVGVSAVSVQEALRGRLAHLARHTSGPRQIQAYALLVITVTVETIQQLPIVAFDAASDARLQHLRMLRLRIGTPDLKIAAVALAYNLTLLTRNRRDFGRVPGLALDDWSV